MSSNSCKSKVAPGALLHWLTLKLETHFLHLSSDKTRSWDTRNFPPKPNTVLTNDNMKLNYQYNLEKNLGESALSSPSISRCQHS